MFFIVFGQIMIFIADSCINIYCILITYYISLKVTKSLQLKYEEQSKKIIYSLLVGM